MEVSVCHVLCSLMPCLSRYRDIHPAPLSLFCEARFLVYSIVWKPARSPTGELHSSQELMSLATLGLSLGGYECFVARWHHPFSDIEVGLQIPAQIHRTQWQLKLTAKLESSAGRFPQGLANNQQTVVLNYHPNPRIHPCKNARFGT